MARKKILSESEEMYLVTLHKIREHCTDTAVPIPELAKELKIQPVSVNQMVNKLAGNGFVKYIPYKGVELTAKGRAISTQILRHRRLWEVFLVKALQMELDDADRLACQFEHVTTPDVTDRLSAYLENPVVCFHGDPIPQPGKGGSKLLKGMPLAHLSIGQASPVLQIDADELTASFLADEGIRPGVEVRLTAIGQNGDVLLESQAGRVHISSEMSSAILVGRPRQL